MPIITSPVSRWPGTVSLRLPSWELAAKWAKATHAAGGDDKTVLEYQNAYIPCVLAWVEKWELGGNFPADPTPETLPVKPLDDALHLVGWLIGEINRLLLEDDPPDPNA